MDSYTRAAVNARRIPERAAPRPLRTFAFWCVLMVAWLYTSPTGFALRGVAEWLR